ncbi:MAG TPA: bifunctional DNA-binding transcriptional regulator/O6-methylguanine-DNA methyltransferase Ada [Myxococcaceae bacterium]|nr:bifunctional DNA-binding transcriptional regulator/O6-methylguanine-DNA methyltransferase Ada [Myxococcaceae bacterium]
MDLHSLDMVHDDPEDGRWEAFVRRDPGADGQFVVAVESTCIYCRPTCPARRPLRKNVRFLPDAATAERQGYRACKRCRPELSQRPAEALVDRVKSLLIANLESPPGLDALARATGLSPAHLQKVFKKHTGLSPKEFVAAARLERWKAELRAGRPVTEAWLEAGYGSAGRAYAAARKQMGMSPAQYGKGGAGQRITWTVLDTPLGSLLLARTDRGLCRVAFGQSAAALETLLRSEFPAAELERASPESDARLRAAAAALGERSAAERLPLDVESTAFQREVWQALRAIPSGSTASYAEVARSIGHPTAVRAVARACATNPVALAVPCHRVVHSDGSLSGYRWGPERKRVLLAEEKESAGSETHAHQ